MRLQGEETIPSVPRLGAHLLPCKEILFGRQNVETRPPEVFVFPSS